MSPKKPRSRPEAAASGGCPFCGLRPQEVVARSAHSVAFRDRFPVSEGHTLVIPLRHVASVFDLPPPELEDLFRLVAAVRADLASAFGPDGFNVGVNDGAAAGQTIGHGHVHVIPRHVGDVPDPRGGVRWVVPARAAYWGKPKGPSGS